jgi:hypothetical protein
MEDVVDSLAVEEQVKGIMSSLWSCRTNSELISAIDAAIATLTSPDPATTRPHLIAQRDPPFNPETALSLSSFLLKSSVCKAVEPPCGSVWPGFHHRLSRSAWLEGEAAVAVAARVDVTIVGTGGASMQAEPLTGSERIASERALRILFPGLDPWDLETVVPLLPFVDPVWLFGHVVASRAGSSSSSSSVVTAEVLSARASELLSRMKQDAVSLVHGFGRWVSVRDMANELYVYPVRQLLPRALAAAGSSFKQRLAAVNAALRFESIFQALFWDAFPLEPPLESPLGDLLAFSGFIRNGLAARVASTVELAARAEAKVMAGASGELPVVYLPPSDRDTEAYLRARQSVGALAMIDAVGFRRDHQLMLPASCEQLLRMIDDLSAPLANSINSDRVSRLAGALRASLPGYMAHLEDVVSNPNLSSQSLHASLSAAHTLMVRMAGLGAVFSALPDGGGAWGEVAGLASAMVARVVPRVVGWHAVRCRYMLFTMLDGEDWAGTRGYQRSPLCSSGVAMWDRYMGALAGDLAEAVPPPVAALCVGGVLQLCLSVLFPKYAFTALSRPRLPHAQADLLALITIVSRMLPCVRPAGRSLTARVAELAAELAAVLALKTASPDAAASVVTRLAQGGIPFDLTGAIPEALASALDTRECETWEPTTVNWAALITPCVLSPTVTHAVAIRNPWLAQDIFPRPTEQEQEAIAALRTAIALFEQRFVKKG